MFDLQFVRTVKRVLRWSEPAQPVKCGNIHESRIAHKNSRRLFSLADTVQCGGDGDMKRLLHDDENDRELELMQYIMLEYPIYFGIPEARPANDFLVHHHTVFGKERA